MKYVWKEFWREFFSYWHYFALGMLLSQFPFLFLLKSHIANKTVLAGFLFNLGFGLTVCSTIFFTIFIFYGVRTYIHIKTGQSVESSKITHFLVVVFGGIVGVFLALFLRNLFLGQRTTAESLFFAFLISGVFGVIFYFYYAYNEAKKKVFANEAALSEARYQTLENQMRPHFLFNALNSLAELIESKEENAAEMTYKLSELYRKILSNSKTKTSPLKAEIEIVQSYLDLEKLRLDSRLDFSFDITDDDIYLPGLMLQTLVENAIKHGVAKSIKGGHVRISVVKENAFYHLSVSNTGEAFRQNSGEGNGLANTIERLNLLYGDIHEFKIETIDEKTVAGFFLTGEKID